MPFVREQSGGTLPGDYYVGFEQPDSQVAVINLNDITARPTIGKNNTAITIGDFGTFKLSPGSTDQFIIVPAKNCTITYYLTISGSTTEATEQLTAGVTKNVTYPGHTGGVVFFK